LGLAVALIAFLVTSSSEKVCAEPTAFNPPTEDFSSAAHPPTPANPALDLRSPTPEDPSPSIFRRWWFWTAVGAAVAATAVVIVISARGPAPPTTNLGNQAFQP